MTSNDSLSIRIKLVVIIVAALFGYLAFHFYKVQIVRHDELYLKAKNQYTSVATTKGKRGEIYDYEGNLLVGNIPSYDICADPQILATDEKCSEVAKFFSRRLDLEYDKIMVRLTQRTRVVEKDGKSFELPNYYALIADRVDWDVVEKIKGEVEQRKFKGISFQDSSKRFYPKNTLLANILGFTSIDKDDVIAVIGLEKFLNKKISPTTSKVLYERARDGLELSYGEKKLSEVRDGLNIYLTIREPIQAILEEEMDFLMEKWSPRAAYAMMADPYTGDIIAVAQRPTFNPNDRKSMNPDAWRNRIAEDTFEPGSTMKPFAVAGALDMGVVSPGMEIDCEGGRWLYGGKILRDSHGYGTLSVSEIIQKSSNIGTAKIAMLMGEKKLYETLKGFGVGEKTGVPLNPETRGIFRDLKKWDKLSISRFPIGQGLAVSPLQLLRSYCILANGGTYVNLRLIDRVENPDTGLFIKPPVKEGKKLYANKETHKKIVDMMKLVTQEGGTAKEAAVKGYYSAGKTGTSQKFIDGAYSEKKFFATYVGFVPADKPAFVLMVTADEPQRAHYGGTVAAPSFSRISEKALRYLNIPPDYEVDETVVDKNADKKQKTTAASSSPRR